MILIKKYQISKDQFLTFLQNNPLAEKRTNLLIAFYNSPSHSNTATNLAKMLGYDNAGPVNILFWKLGKRIADYLGVDSRHPDGTGRRWVIMADEEKSYKMPKSHYLRVMRKDLKEAIEEFGLVDVSGTYPDEIIEESNQEIYEGAKKTVVVNQYERNPQARQKCLEHYGYDCVICGFNFEKVYGELGKYFIHVHHIVPLSKIAKAYQIDPIKDLRPVCPNCHAMIHSGKEVLSLEVLRSFLNS